ncbi:MAG TPA: ribonuclease HII [Chitinophagaceae bacterium]|nr:ribonuclease HII [Chitinophagaceae bacterium]
MEKEKPLLNPFYHEELTEAGCDEAGRGCYAGPVIAAAVILPKNFYHPTLNDSKLLTPAERHELKFFIKANAIAYAVAMVDNEEIDQINILRASFKAMHLALDKLRKRPFFLLIDGNRFTPYKKLRHECIVQGDGKYASIAAASVLAKTHRDAYMRQLHKEFPYYNWKQNKGYGTEEHRNAIEVHGVCKYHRKSFNIMSNQISMFEEDDLPEAILENNVSLIDVKYEESR